MAELLAFIAVIAVMIILMRFASIAMPPTTLPSSDGKERQFTSMDEIKVKNGICPVDGNKLLYTDIGGDLFHGGKHKWGCSKCHRVYEFHNTIFFGEHLSSIIKEEN